MTGEILIAGVGNIFLGDDGFGVEVASRLASATMPRGVHVKDFGIRGIHLAYELMERWGALILIDAMPRGEAAGTLYVTEPDLNDEPGDFMDSADPHGMDPQSVLGIVRSAGAQIGQVYVVGCEPYDISEGIGLSDPVARSVDAAVDMVRDLVSEIIRKRILCIANRASAE